MNQLLFESYQADVLLRSGANIGAPLSFDL